jgi:hypothetical protein
MAAAPAASEIADLLALTHQGAFAPEAMTACAQFIAQWPGEAWRRADKTGQPLSVVTCLYAYMAALDEALDPQLTLDRLARNAGRADEAADYHVRHALELSAKARARDLKGEAGLAADHRRAMAAHVTCANDARAQAVEIRILRAALAAELETEGALAAA